MINFFRYRKARTLAEKFRVEGDTWLDYYNKLNASALPLFLGTEQTNLKPEDFKHEWPFVPPKVEDATLFPIIQKLAKYESDGYLTFGSQVSAIFAFNEAKKKARIKTSSSEYCQNIFIAMDGTLRPLPFNGGVGIWYFDGQFYYKKPLLTRRRQC